MVVCIGYIFTFLLCCWYRRRKWAPTTKACGGLENWEGLLRVLHEHSVYYVDL